MARTKIATGEDTLEFRVDGKSVKIVTRPADGDQLARLFELGETPAFADASPMTDEDVAALVRGLIDEAHKHGEQAGVLGVPPAAATRFPDDSRIYVSPVEPVSFSLPGSPCGLILEMNDRGDAHLWALGDTRIDLGSDGMWWIVNALIDVLVEPSVAAKWPRFLTLGTSLGGRATQATLECSPGGIGILWRTLRSGVVGEIVAEQELSYDRVDGWLRILRPVRDDLERRRVHRQRLRPARTAEKWARVLERWSEDSSWSEESAKN